MLAFNEKLEPESTRNIEQLFLNISKQVDKQIENLIPLVLDEHKINKLFASDHHEYYLENVDLKKLIDTINKPIRSITDRSAKRWRSYALVACCEIVGGNFDPYQPWLAVPELIHTGSLIIDDIQDQSLIRRGDKSCHVIYGEPLAINAGNFAYSLFYVVLNQTELPPERRCQIYELFFDTYRAAHAGQAIDIQGLLPEFAEAIETKDASIIEKRIIGIHRLKSAIPIASVAKMGAILGQGSPVQIQVLGEFFETIGIAFQMMDDILNLTGFSNNHKCLAEDLQSGKVTYPIAKAIRYLDNEQLTLLWHTLNNKTDNPQVYSDIIALLDEKKVFETCYLETQDMVKHAWGKIDECFKPSKTKSELKAFCYYLVHRHY